MMILAGCAHDTSSDLEPTVIIDNNSINEDNDIPDSNASKEILDWQTYELEQKFRVKYPKDWQVVSESNTDQQSPDYMAIAFGSQSMNAIPGYDGEFFVFFRTDKDLETLITEIGDQFEDRQESREDITINDQSAIKITVMTPSISDWKYEGIFFEKGEGIYELSNGAIKNDQFENFYNSFELL